MQRMLSSAIVLSVLAVSACRAPLSSPKNPTASSRQILSASGDTLTVNDRTPDTADSLEVGHATGAELQITLIESGTILIGHPSSKRLTIFLDTDCFYCRQFLTTDLPWIEEEFVRKQRLSVALVFVPMTQSGDEGARMALCATKQGKFREINRLLAAHLPMTDPKKTAKAIGMSLSTLKTCLTKKDLLEENIRLSAAKNIERVPFFILDDESWVGLLSKEELHENIAQKIQ